MGRPPLGRAATSVVLSTKGTQFERDRLIEMYGSVYQGMKVGLEMALGGHQARGGRVDEVQEADFDDEPRSADADEGQQAYVIRPQREEVGTTVEDGKVKAHRHRRGDVIRVEGELGSEVKVYQCTGCDKEMR